MRLSPTTSPINTSDVTSGTLYYTDGRNFISVAVPAAVGQYDVANNASGLVLTPFNPNRSNMDYVGSINVTVPGQLTCHVDIDFDRRWEVYNALNQKPIMLRVITQERGITPCPTYPAWAPAFLNPRNRGGMFVGNPELVEVEYIQAGFLDTLYGGYAILNSVGWDGNPVGATGGGTDDTNYCARGIRMWATYRDPSVIGAHVATMLILAGVHSASRRSAIYSAPMGPPMDVNGVMYIKWLG